MVVSYLVHILVGQYYYYYTIYSTTLEKFFEAFRAN
jgi:hypothetical protein